MGLMDPYTNEEHGFLKVTAWLIKGSITCGGKG